MVRRNPISLREGTFGFESAGSGRIHTALATTCWLLENSTLYKDPCGLRWDGSQCPTPTGPAGRPPPSGRGSGVCVGVRISSLKLPGKFEAV